ncbi:MAG: hypothetical protein J6L69_00345 [Lachnospiraceae bacterium]|nr:hypothetical protein [Lachnospiraceae bacterium]
MGKKITIFLFIATIFTLSIVTFVAKDREFSEMENRVLSGKPEFSAEKLLSGEFASNLETYLADQMFLKDNFVMLKNSYDLLCGKDMLGEVYYCDDRYIRNFEENEKQSSRNILLINEWLKKNNIPKDKASFVLAPTASYVYNEQLPSINSCDDESNTFDLIEDAFLGKFISLKDVMADADVDADIYYKTDHHWTMMGAYLGYEEVMKQLDKEPISLEDMKEVKLDELFYGSLHSQAPLLFVEGEEVVYYDYKDLDYTITYVAEDEETKTFLVEDKFDVKDKYTALFGGNFGRMTIINHDNPDGDKLIIFKDSYANSIIPYLISNYSVIEVIDLRYVVMIPGFYSDKTDYDVMFIYNTDFINTDNSFVKLMSF